MDYEENAHKPVLHLCATQKLLQAGKLKVSLLTVMSTSICWLGLWQGMNKEAWAGDTTGKTESQDTSFMKVGEKKISLTVLEMPELAKTTR